MIRKLKSGEYRLYARKKDPKTGKRRNLGTFSSLEKAKQHESEVQYFKKHEAHRSVQSDRGERCSGTEVSLAKTPVDRFDLRAPDSVALPQVLLNV